MRCQKTDSVLHLQVFSLCLLSSDFCPLIPETRSAAPETKNLFIEIAIENQKATKHMNLRCPKCSKQLPEVETLEYRFCPHCGAEITAKPQQLEEAFLTIPPDLPPPRADLRPRDLSSETEKKITVAGQFDDQTIEPQPGTSRNRPEIKPPLEPPPPHFRRMPSEDADPPPPKPKKQPPTKNQNKIIIAVLILLAVVILILGGLFTF